MVQLPAGPVRPGILPLPAYPDATNHFLTDHHPTNLLFQHETHTANQDPNSEAEEMEIEPIAANEDSCLEDSTDEELDDHDDGIMSKGGVSGLSCYKILPPTNVNLSADIGMLTLDPAAGLGVFD